MSNWIDRAAELKIKENKSWAEVYRIIRQEYKLNLKNEGIRFQVRAHSLYKQAHGEQQTEQLPTQEEMVKAEKDRLVKKHKEDMLNRLLRERAATDIIADKCIQAISVLPAIDIKPINFYIKQEYKEQEVVLQISDIQAGTYIDLETTGGLNEYNRHILKKQFDKLYNSVASIITREKKVTPIHKMNQHWLGDFVEGIDIFVGQAQHVDQDLYDQVFSLADLLVEFIVKCLYLFDEIEISAVGGNHGRIGKKGENPHYVNWDLIVAKYVEAKMQNYKHVKFNIPKSWWYLDTIQGHNFLLLHGDDIKAWNGIPYYGIDRADAKWTKLLKSKDKFYEYMELGHFHSPSELASVDGEKIINGCWPGGSVFALKSLVTSGRPRQNMFFVHPEQGKAASYPIWLEV